MGGCVSVVVDASSLAALIFGEPAADLVAARLSGHKLAAPSIMPCELANVAAVKVRRGSIGAAHADESLHFADSMGIEIHTIGSTVMFEAALATGLSAYDAAYWILARALTADLVTLDGELERATRRPR